MTNQYLFGIGVCISVLLAFALIGPNEARAQAGTFQYVVKKDGGCKDAAKAVYGDGAEWRKIHIHNKKLGPRPHKLKKGQVLILPKPEGMDPDAKVTRTNGVVNARPPTAGNWKKANTGLDLYRAWRVNSKEEASAELTFRDASRLQMRQNTVVIVYGGTYSTSRRLTIEAELESGALRTRLGELAGEKPEMETEVVITTPASIARLQQAAALLAVESNGVTRLANHAGKAAVVEGRDKPVKGKKRPKKRKKRKQVTVKVGYGSKIKPGEDPSPPKLLPKTPSWTAGLSDRFITLGPKGVISGSWDEVKEAKSYRVEIYEDDKGSNLTHRVEVAAPVRRFEVRELPPGTYYVSVASIDDDAFEGKATELKAYHLVALNARVEGDASTLWQGDVIEAGGGVTCVVAGESGAPSAKLVLAQAGEKKLQCVDKGGERFAPALIEVAPIKIEVKRANGEVLTFLVGEPQIMVLRVEDGVLDGFNSKRSFSPRLLAPPGVTVDGPTTGPEIGSVVYEVLVSEAFEGDTMKLDLVLGEGETAAPLDSFTHAVVRKEVVPVEEPPIVELGAFLGLGLLNDEDAYGDTPLDSSVRTGLGIGVFLTEGLLLEGEFTFARPTQVSKEALFELFGFKSHLLYDLASGSYRPFLLLGGGAELVPDLDGVLPLAHVGGGVRVVGEGALGFRGAVTQSFSFSDGLGVPLTELRLGLTLDF